MRTLAVLALVVSVPTAALADEARRCTRAKVRAAAEYVRAYHACWAEAAAVGAEPSFPCLVAATDTVRARIAAANARGPCLGSPDRVANGVCVPSIGPGDAACRAAKYRAAGWRFARRLVCHGDGLRRDDGLRAACLLRNDRKFAQRIARADALGPCGSTATQLASIVDRCALDMSSALSCGNGRLDYGELCEGDAPFCAAAACQIVGGGCCVTPSGCFQFDGPIEHCFFAGGLDALPGFCTTGGCVDDVAIATTPVCCQPAASACVAASAMTASQLRELASACGSASGIAVIGACGSDGRCVPSDAAPVALPTTTTAPPTSTTTTTVPGATTTTTQPFPICTNIGGACGGCGTGTCAQPIDGIPVGVCVVPTSSGPCAEPPPACAADAFCLTSINECRALCY